MFRSTCRAICTLAAVLLLLRTVNAQQKAAFDLLPDNVQAALWIPNSELLIERWDRTQLSKLASDPAVRPFFEDQRQEIERRFIDAGWRLNVKPEDLAEFSSGQIAVAWLEKADSPRKPFALALVADVASDPAINEQLLEKIDDQLRKQQAVKSELRHADVEIIKYTLPARAGEFLAQNTYHAIVNEQLLSTDDEQLIKDMISRAKLDAIGAVLSQDPDFRAGREALQISGDAQLEYFVRPLGLARVLRSIGGKRSKSSSDVLAILQNQGFASIKCICGEVTIGLEAIDIQHKGYVLADRPLPKSAGILDFPNQASREIPNFVGKNISSMLATHWNAEEAFWRIEGLVDELAGQEGVFDEVIQGIKRDPNGPRIDIEQDVLPHFTNDIYSISDSKEGIPEIDSRRNLIALKVNNAEAMSKVLDRAMENEPHAEQVEFGGHEIWKVAHRDDDEFDLTDDFGDFEEDSQSDQDAAQPEPWLSNWAITVYGDYLMFASHVEVIQDAITQANSGDESPLVTEPDYQRITAAIAEHFGEEEGSAWKIVRNNLAYRVQYELFREGKLQQSQSMLASILDRLLQSDSEMRGKDQKVSGKNLPPFAQIAHFLQPSGMMVRTTDRGWQFGNLLLSSARPAPPKARPAPPKTEEEVTGVSQIGTARVSNADAEAKR